jgi:hypothetical protein
VEFVVNSEALLSGGDEEITERGVVLFVFDCHRMETFKDLQKRYGNGTHYRFQLHRSSATESEKIKPCADTRVEQMRSLGRKRGASSRLGKEGRIDYI